MPPPPAAVEVAAHRTRASTLSFALPCLALLALLAGCPQVDDQAPQDTAEGNDGGAAAETGPKATGPCGLLAAPAPIALPAGASVEAVLDDAYLDKARQLIRSAGKRLDIVQFQTDSSAMVDLLVDDVIAAYKRGVTVRVLFDETIAANDKLRARLQSACVSARLDSGAVRTHVKLIYTEQAFMVGSTNWSAKSIGANHEADLIVRHKGARTAMGLYVDALWKNSSQPAKVKLSSNKEAAVYGDAGYVDAVLGLLEDAKERIWLATYTLSVDPKNPDGDVNKLVDALDKAVDRGVDVRVLLDLSGDWAKVNNEVNAKGRAFLEDLGVPVRQEDPEVQTHAKLLVVDDTLVLGSNNWSFGGLRKYHEAGLRTNVKSAVDTLATYHEGIWKTGK